MRRAERRKLDMAGRRMLWRLPGCGVCAPCKAAAAGDPDPGVCRLRRCGRTPKGLSVDLAVGEHGASFRGLTTCGSVWSCPDCARKIMAARGEDLGAAVRAWEARGGRLAFVTLTMRHRKGQALDALWEALSDAWAAARQKRTTRDLMGLCGGPDGKPGFVRVVECTEGENGWHLHVHLLVFLERADLADELGASLFAGWAARLSGKRHGLDAPIAHKGGLDVKLVDGEQAAEAIAEYVSKGVMPEEAQDGPSIERELTGRATKRARRGNRTPLGILADLVDLHEGGGYGSPEYARTRALWLEWERASYGRRAVQWSQGLREALGLGDELSDDEVADDERLPGEVVARIPGSDWRELRYVPELHELLTIVERAAPELRYDVAAGWLARRGFRCLRPLPPPEPIAVGPPGVTQLHLNVPASAIGLGS